MKTLCLKLFVAVAFGSFLTELSLWSQGPGTVIPLYEGVAPGSESWTQTEIIGVEKGVRDVRNVVIPTLEVFEPEPENAVGSAIIIMPGGGMMFISMENEGYPVAEWFVKKGFHAFILKYRLAKTPENESEYLTFSRNQIIDLMNPSGNQENVIAAHTPIAVEDGRQAIRMVRELAGSYGYDSERIVAVGFSAGGRIALGCALSPEPADRPNCAGFIYTGILEEGDDAVLEVPEGMPPSFIACATNDPLVYTMQYPLFSQLRKKGVRTELHLYDRGRHGFGMTPRNETCDHWTENFYWWLQARGMTGKSNHED